MFTAVGFHWWLEFLKFILAVFIAFYIPGSFFLASKNKSSLVNFTLSVLIGLVLWGWQEFVFGYISLRDLTYFYLVFGAVVWTFKVRPKKLTSFWVFIKNLSLKEVDWRLFCLVFLGVFIQAFAVWSNGVYSQQKGLFFIGGNLEDNLWHASLTYEMARRFPPFGPGLSGVLMRNYHYWSNLVIAGFVRVFKLPLFPTQFQFFPLLISFLLGMVTISLGKILNFGKNITRLFVFFNYFGGDLIYLFLIFLRSIPELFVMSSLEDGAKFFHNPPRAFSFVIALGGICLFIFWQQNKKDLLSGFLSMFLLASTTGFKIYTSIFFAIGILILISFAFLKRDWKNLFILSSFYILAALIYLPTNSQAGGLVWAPFSIVNNFIMQPWLGLDRWEQARVIFFEDKKYLHNLVFETVFTSFFLLGILGTKILGFFQSPFYLFKRLGKELTIILLAGIFLSLIGGIFFIQATGGANTFNFLVSVFLFSSILVALSVDFWQKKLPKFLSLFLIILIILLTIPRVSHETILNIKKFLKSEGFLITNEELELYDFVNNQPSSSGVAIYPNDKIGKATPYVSLFINNKPLLLSGRGLLKHFRLEGIEEKEGAQEVIFKSPFEKNVARELLVNQIAYIILYDNQSLKATPSAYFTNLVMKNKKGTVLEVDNQRLKEILKIDIDR